MIRLSSVIVFFAIVVSFSSCSGGKTDGILDEEKAIANDFKGGNKVVRIAEVIPPSSLFPHQITNAVEGLITSQIHEGLVKINPKDLSITPGLAEKW